MALARWKDLCIDAVAPGVVAPFWAAALGRELRYQPEGDAELHGSGPGEMVWVNTVREPKTGWNRVHLDLVRDEHESLLAAGASVVRARTGAQPWTVLRDPEGNELCVFPPHGDPPSALVTHANDPEAQAAWWAEVLGAAAQLGPDGLRRWLRGVPGLPYDVWKFVGTTEPKTVKNRWHWDLVCDDIAALVARGAVVLRGPDDEISWTVLADPEGNEFCAFTP